MNVEEKWISIYIYHETFFEKVIIELLKPMINSLVTKRQVKSFFFIRYWEGGPHLRFRVLVNEKVNKERIKCFLEKQITDYFVINNIKFSIRHEDYIRELNRYGGRGCIITAENHFENSSKIIMNIIEDNYSQWKYSMSISVSIQMNLIFAKRTILSLEDTILFFSSIYQNRLHFSIQNNKKPIDLNVSIKELVQAFSKLYINQKNKIDFLVKTIWMENNDERWLKEWSCNCKHLKVLMDEALSNDLIIKPNSLMYINNDKLSNDNRVLWTIYESYIHMSNNRLGVRIQDESFVAFLIVNSLKVLKNIIK
jgi:thiopeptide-type bacteriocin biosynthesis protein